MWIRPKLDSTPSIDLGAFRTDFGEGPEARSLSLASYFGLLQSMYERKDAPAP